MNRDEWEEAVSSCDRCGSNRCSKPLVPTYIEDAKVWIQFSTPGRLEIESGREWTKSLIGKVLPHYLWYLGVNPEEVYITFSAFCRKSEFKEYSVIDRCRYWKKDEFSHLSNIKAVVLLGNDAFRQSWGSSAPSVVRISGSIFRLDGDKKGLVVMHPGFLQRNPSKRKDVYAALQRLGRQCGFK